MLQFGKFVLTRAFLAAFTLVIISLVVFTLMEFVPGDCAERYLAFKNTQGSGISVEDIEIERKRRHGMGYLGLGSTITMMGMSYGDSASVAFTEEVTKILALVGWETGLELAKEQIPEARLICHPVGFQLRLNRSNVLAD